MYALGIDFGTSNTVAAVHDGERVRHLLFDGSPLLPSAVSAAPAGLLVGADAIRAAVGNPAGFEANPKRRVDDGTVWLGDRDVPVVALIAAVLRTVLAEAVRVTGEPPARTVLTHPAAWARSRLEVLTAAASSAGLTDVVLLPEPVAAAAHFAAGRRITSGHCLVVYDLGAGTFDATVVRADGFEVLATAGLDDAGGLDLDAAVVAHARTAVGAAGVWERLDRPQTAADRHATFALWQAARAVKEQLSRHPTGELHVPLAGSQVHLTRAEFEAAAHALLQRTVALTASVLTTAGVPADRVAGVYLVGGSSRIPLAATLLHRALGVAPTVLDQPELVVAEGAVRHAVPQPPTLPVDAVATRANDAEPVARTPPAAPARGRRVVAVAAVGLLLAAAVALAVTRPWQGSTGRPAGTAPSVPAAPSALPARFPAEWEGTWKGSLVQSNGKSHPLVLTVTGGAEYAQIRYPSLGCQGLLTVLARTGDTVRAQEVVKDVVKDVRCTSTGIFMVSSPSPGTLSLQYTPDQATYTGSATLALAAAASGTP